MKHLKMKMGIFKHTDIEKEQTMNFKQILTEKQNADQANFLKLIKREWSFIVGDSVASKSRPLKLMDNCLTITADTALARNDLTLLNAAVINRIKDKYKIKIANVKVRYN